MFSTLVKFPWVTNQPLCDENLVKISKAILSTVLPKCQSWPTTSRREIIQSVTSLSVKKNSDIELSSSDTKLKVINEYVTI